MRILPWLRASSLFACAWNTWWMRKKWRQNPVLYRCATLWNFSTAWWFSNTTSRMTRSSCVSLQNLCVIFETHLTTSYKCKAYSVHLESAWFITYIFQVHTELLPSHSVSLASSNDTTSQLHLKGIPNYFIVKEHTELLTYRTCTTNYLHLYSAQWITYILQVHGGTTVGFHHTRSHFVVG